MDKDKVTKWMNYPVLSGLHCFSNLASAGLDSQLSLGVPRSGGGVPSADFSLFLQLKMRVGDPGRDMQEIAALGE